MLCIKPEEEFKSNQGTRDIMLFDLNSVYMNTMVDDAYIACSLLVCTCTCSSFANHSFSMSLLCSVCISQ